MLQIPCHKDNYFSDSDLRKRGSLFVRAEAHEKRAMAHIQPLGIPFIFAGYGRERKNIDH